METTIARMIGTLLVLALAVTQAPPKSVAPRTSWELSFAGWDYVAPAGDRVVLCQSDGVYANDVATGKSIWARRDLAQGFRRPTVGGGSVYASAATGADSASTTAQATYALELATGATRWQCTYWAYEGVAFAGDRVVGIGTPKSGGELAVFALHAKDGKPAWTRPIDGLHKTSARPVVAEGLVLFVAKDVGVVALRAADGQLAWNASADALAQVVAARGVVVTVGPRGLKGVARGHSVAGGQPLWTVWLSAPATGIAFAGDDVLVLGWSGELVRIELASGKERWRKQLGAGSTKDPLVLGKIVLARRDDRSSGETRRIWTAVDLATGTVAGDALEVDDYDSLTADGTRVWWSQPKQGKLVALDFAGS